MPAHLLRRSRIPTLGAALLTALAGCAMTGSPETPDLVNSAWRLAELEGQAVPTQPAATLNFAAGQAQGTDGCNRFAGPYTGGTAGELGLGERMAATQMACDPDVMDLARRYLDALAATRSYRLEAGQLVLLGATGQALARLAPVPRTLAGSRWRVKAYNNGRDAVVSTQLDTVLTVEFLADGRVAGSAGCNNFTGSFEDQQSGLRIGPLAATRRMCIKPDGIMDQEAAFLRALEAATVARRDGDRLELRDASGALQVQLAADEGSR